MIVRSISSNTDIILTCIDKYITSLWDIKLLRSALVYTPYIILE